MSRIKLRNNILAFAFFLFGLIPIASQRIEAIITFIFSILVLLGIFLNKSNNRRKNGKFFFLNSSLFFVLLLTLFDGFDIQIVKDLERMLSLLVFPLLFFLISNIEENQKKQLFKIWKFTFVSSVFISFVCYLFIFYNYDNPKYPVLDSNFIRNSILDQSYFSRHPIYISIFFSISIFILIDFLFKTRIKKYRIIALSLIICNSILLILLSAKMVLIALFTCCIIYFYKQLSLKKFSFLVSTLLGVICLFFILIPNNLNRFSNLLESKLDENNKRYNSLYIHSKTISCASKIFSHNTLIGVGIENSDDLVNNCVREDFKYDSHIIYNSHNQYLSFGLHSGIIGFLLLFYVIIQNLIYSFKNNYLLFMTLVFFSIIFLSENVIERQSGVILFAFIINSIQLLKPKETVH